MKTSTKIIIVGGIVLLILLIWGLVGSSKAAEMGISCDFGLGEDGSVFCWKWHKNVIGEIGDTLSQLFSK